MRKIVLFIITCLCFNIQSVSSQTMRIYHIGNSVTDALNYGGFKALAESEGFTHVWGRHMIPGAPLSWLWEHPNDGFQEQPFGYPTNAFPNYTWDAITLQPFDRGLHGDQGDVPIAGNYINLAKGNSPDVQIYIFSRWPRKPDNFQNTAQEWNDLWNRPAGTWVNEARIYFEDLIDELRAVHTDIKPVLMVPVGDVFYNLNQRMASGEVPGFNSIWDVYPDGIHMDNIGSYITGLTFYATLYKSDPRGTVVPSQYGTINASLASIIQSAVWEVVSNHPLSGVSDHFIAVSGVSLTPQSVTISVGETSQLNATVSPVDATNKNVTWSSSNPLVVSVDNSGVLTGTGQGEATVTVTTADGGWSASSSVTVTSTVTEDTEPPTTPQNLSASEIRNDRLTLIWSHSTDNVGVIGYDIFSTETQLNTSLITENTFTVTGLSECSQYSFTVRANDAAGNFSDSHELSIKTNCKPVAVIEYSRIPGRLTVQFDASGSYDPDEEDFILGYEWDFGDGSPLNNSNAPVHEYEDFGTYTVSLRVMDNRDFYSDVVTVTLIFDQENEPVLLSGNKTVFTSSEERDALGGSNVVDGDLSTRWGSRLGSDDEWIYIDLGQSEQFNKIVFVWETAFARRYKIQVSDDAQEWIDVFAQDQGEGGMEAIEFSMQQSRYVRMLGLERGTDYGYSLHLFDVYYKGETVALNRGQLSKNHTSFAVSARGNILNITGSYEYELDIRLLDIRGRIVRRWNVDSSQRPALDISAVPNGMYVLHASSGGKRFSVPLILNRK